MEYHVFKQVIQTVLIAILIPFGAMIILEIIPTIIGNKAARQAAKKIQELKERNADLITEVEESKQKIVKLLGEREADNRKIAELTKKHEAGKHKIAELTKKHEADKHKIAELTKELEADKHKIAELTKELEAGKHKIAELTKELEAGKHKIAELTKELEAGRHKIAELTKELEESDQESQLLTDALYVETENAEKYQLKIVDQENELDAARNFAATTLNTAFQNNQEAREITVDTLKDLSEGITVFRKIAEISNNSMKQHLEQVRKFCNIGLHNWSGEIKLIQECIRLDFGRIKLLDEATAKGHNLQATLDEIDEAAKKQSPYFNAPSPSCSCSA
ncbi:hypothetical protein HER10_EVM0007795 [Colletotrichum scovillei]|uniref:LPXTG cell wall anchor domain-containing protein n=1 Tax=Colletotrichum scovillei TaxID=1209932 RepID=A0A9P7QVZ6_9PEZI|nr:uncharacterized protein HER10_EVM0007795 [Colletotrichum scovillei]KAF4784387.1 hypothetical protein HER10_EVM0007795 [Colletotrichum scovillei]KAG7044479.1 LPXTG cell wall anchor domain-containing protein [Colletotrichum scovillei]KAG7049188.1 LPXTG cell wall anchor domain-containing protein [Colletotrichum scovillei]KAG7063931.1 LPXTG cell wall anchor domain-containing protein [Colletotrichum scovillei]